MLFFCWFSSKTDHPRTLCFLAMLAGVNVLGRKAGGYVTGTKLVIVPLVR